MQTVVRRLLATFAVGIAGGFAWARTQDMAARLINLPLTPAPDVALLLGVLLVLAAVGSAVYFVRRRGVLFRAAERAGQPGGQHDPREGASAVPPEPHLPIRTPDQRVRVFVSSTLQELADERSAAREAITQLRLTPVMFELGARPHPPRPLYRAYLAQSDVFIGIYWQHYGWVAPGEEISGLEDEYRLAGNRPKLIYTKTPHPAREPRLQVLLKRMEVEGTVCYKPFTTTEELRELIEDDLAMVLTESFDQARTPGQIEAPIRPLDNLPVERSPLIDRTEEVVQVRDLLLREDAGLVTVIGTGGSGKTRLALHVAGLLRESFEDGVVFVPLASITDPDLVAPAIAQGLKVREMSGQPLLENLQDYLRTKRLLLVVDNFEHLLSASGIVSLLLDQCPRLRVLATSRAPLHVHNEKEVLVPPLRVPDLHERPTLERLSQYAAVELFIQRAREVKPGFAVSNETAPAVAGICQRLDGLPLAIELAAARIKLFPPKALLSRLDRRLPLLITGARDLPRRQQTLRGTIEWSYDLLDAAEKQLFRRLAVFSGGFTLNAAQAVCAVGRPLSLQADAAQVDSSDLLAGIESLLDKSLLWVQEGPEGEPRFGMLETIREYAGDRLAESEESAAVRRRHSEVFLLLAEMAEPFLTSGSRQPWLDRLATDLDNIREALRWSLSPENEGETGVRLVGALSWFWYLRGQTSEGRRWIQEALAVATAAIRPVSRGRALFALGAVAWAQGDFLEARSALEQAVDMFRDQGDGCNLGHALTMLGVVHGALGDLVGMSAHSQESLDLLRAAGDHWWEAFTLSFLGDAATRAGELEAAQSFCEQSLTIYERLGDCWGQAVATVTLGRLAAARGDLATAVTHYRTSIALFRELNDKHGLGLTLVTTAGVVWQQGDHQEAEKLWREALALWQDLGNRTYVVLSLGGLAQVVAARGDRRRAARLLGTVTSQAQALGSTQFTAYATILKPLFQAIFDQAVVSQTVKLDETGNKAGWEEGSAMTLDQCVAYALGEKHPDRSCSDRANIGSSTDGAGLQTEH